MLPRSVPRLIVATRLRCTRAQAGRARATLAGLAICCLSAGTLVAQADRIDGGSFTLLHDGQRVGREQFSLRRAGSTDGTAYELRSESSIGDRRVAVQLSADSTGAPVRYSLEIRQDTTVVVRAGGQRARGRFATQARRPGGETAREYILTPGVLILEPDFYHQLAFVVRGRKAEVGKPVEVLALSLLDNTQHTLRVQLESLEDEVTIAGAPRLAARWRLEDEAGLVRTVWSDAAGRVLRVVVPSQSIEAVRDELPGLPQKVPG